MLPLSLRKRPRPLEYVFLKLWVLTGHCGWACRRAAARSRLTPTNNQEVNMPTRRIRIAAHRDRRTR
jgi:hypothetical protein